MLDSIIGFLVGISEWSAANIPFNIWFYLAYGIAPLLAFTTKPDASGRRRITYLLLAALITYLSLTLMNFTWVARLDNEYDTCQSQFPDGDINHNPACPERVNSGANYAFYPLFGWILGASYVGIWEIIWRLWYRKKIKRQQIAI